MSEESNKKAGGQKAVTPQQIATGEALGVRSEIKAGRQFTLVPEGYVCKSLELWQEIPWDKRGTVTLQDAESFIGYVNDHSTECTRIFAPVPDAKNPALLSITAILNWHLSRSNAGPIEPGWGDHRAVLQLLHTPEWQVWNAISGQPKTQKEFAQFLENNAPDVADPPAAVLQELVLAFEATKSASFKGGIRLQNGAVSLSYVEEVNAKGPGNITIPPMLTLALSPFEGLPRYKVEARFRYSLGGEGKLSMWVELVRPHLIVRDALKNITETIAQETEVPVLVGNPPAALR